MNTLKKYTRSSFIASSPHYLITFLLCLFSVFNSSAQTQKTWQWVRQLGGDSWDITAGVVCDSKDNLYVTGSFYHTLFCGNKKLPSGGNQDIFLARFNTSGTLKDLWACGGKGNDASTCICTKPDNSIVIGGMISDSASFGKVKINKPGKQLVVANLDAKGKFTWATGLTFTGEASLYLLSADDQGNIYASGSFTGTLESGTQTLTSRGKKDIFLARFTKTGSVETLTSFGSEKDDIPTSLSVDKQGTIALTGTFEEELKIDSLKLKPGNGAKTNVFVVAFDRTLKVKWNTQLTGIDYVKISSIKHDTNGNLYATGSFSRQVKTTDTVFTSKGYTDILLLKYAPDGKMLWGRSAGSWYFDYATHVNVDNLGGAIITGSTGDTLTVDTIQIPHPKPGDAALVLQFGANGKALWGDCISSQGQNFSDGSVLDSKGNLYLNGSFSNTFEKGDGTLTSFGYQDVFIAKYYNCPASKADVYGLRTLCPGTGTELSIAHGYKNVLWQDSLANTNYFMVQKPGQYWVSMYDKKGCLLTDTFELDQEVLPRITLGNDTALLVGDTLLLHATTHYNTLLWQDFSSEATYKVTAPEAKPGTVTCWIKVTDSLNCIIGDTIQITFVKGRPWIELSKAQLTTWPNPINDRVYWSVSTDKPCRLIVEVTDESGHILYEQDIENYQPGEQREIFLGNIPIGAYNLRIGASSTSGDFKTTRVIKQ